MPRQSSPPGFLQRLAPTLAQALQQCGLGHLVLLGQIVAHWPKIAGAQLAAVTQPESIRGRVLFITVRDAIWLQQITFYQAQLLENIRRVLREVPITKLHFTLAMSSSQPPAPAPLNEEQAPLPLTAAEAEQVWEETASIADPELREAVRRAWQQGWQARR